MWELSLLSQSGSNSHFIVPKCKLEAQVLKIHIPSMWRSFFYDTDLSQFVTSYLPSYFLSEFLQPLQLLAKPFSENQNQQLSGTLNPQPSRVLYHEQFAFTLKSGLTCLLYNQLPDLIQFSKCSLGAYYIFAWWQAEILSLTEHQRHISPFFYYPMVTGF